MRKVIVVLLIVVIPRLAFSQTAIVLELSVHRIPVTELGLNKCENLRVLFFSKDDILGILTPYDTLQLKRVMIESTQPGESVVLCYDEFHGNQPYRVAIIREESGILMYFNPLVRISSSGKFRRAFWNVSIEPPTNPLYCLVMSSHPCN